jgi:hypothetical protein
VVEFVETGDDDANFVGLFQWVSAELPDYCDLGV